MTLKVARELPDDGNAAKVIQAALQVAAGAATIFGGAISTIAGAWSQREQAKVNQFFERRKLLS